MLRAHQREPVVPPSRLRPEIPPDLESVVLKCLEKKPDDRYQDARSLEEALTKCICAQDWNEALMDDWWSRHPGPYFRPEDPVI